MHTPVHDPAAIYRYRDSLAAADCLCAAIAHLDLFTLLDRQPVTLAGLCTRLGIHARPADVMLALCAANGLVARDAAGVFRATGLAREFLVAGSPCDARPYYASMADKPGVADWLKVLRTGKPANWPGEEGEADWHAAMRTESFAESFTAAMDCRGRVLAPALAKAVDLRDTRRLLDVGGGSGVYAIGCVEAYPQLRASEQFTGLREALASTEDALQAARRYYNASVRELNESVRMFPGNLIAGIGGFRQREFFEIASDAERAVPVVSLGKG